MSPAFFIISIVSYYDYTYIDFLICTFIFVVCFGSYKVRLYKAGLDYEF